jgi:hypothetical protein
LLLSQQKHKRLLRVFQPKLRKIDKIIFMHSLETFRIRKTKPEFEIVCIKSLEKKGLEEPYKIKTNPRKRLRSLLKTTYHISIRPLTGKKSKIMTPRPKRRSRNSSRKGTCKIYNTSPKLGGCNDLTHGKAVFNNKEYGYHLLAKPNGSNVHATSLKYPLTKSPSQVGGCNVLIHGKAVFNNKEYGCHLLAKPDGSNVHATSLILSKTSKKTSSCNDLTLGKAVSNNKEYGCHLLAQPKGSNVHATSLFRDPNPNPETEI